MYHGNQEGRLTKDFDKVDEVGTTYSRLGHKVGRWCDHDLTGEILR